MKREFGLDQIVHHASSHITIGTFDGVHRGHQAIIEYLVHRAHEAGGESVVVTFDPHPRDVLTGTTMPLLTTLKERAELLEVLGLGRFVVLPFTEALAGMEAEDFVRDLLVGRIGAVEMVIGYDHAFGRGRRGNAELLRAMGAELGFDVDVIPAQVLEQHIISSTQIRTRLGQGQVREAAEMLGRPYHLAGRVVKGDQRGRTIGFPTANLELVDLRKLMPQRGVYAVYVELPAAFEATVPVPAMANLGVRPTFDGLEERFEVYVIEEALAGPLTQPLDLYDEVLTVFFMEYVRAEQKFDTIAALVRQLEADKARCISLLKALSFPDVH